MPDTFHHFSLLPFELREEIWKLAVRPAGPTAHMFAVYPRNFNYKDHKGEKGDRAWRDFQAFHPSRGLWSLGAPQCLPRDGSLRTSFTPNKLKEAAAPI